MLRLVPLVLLAACGPPPELLLVTSPSPGATLAAPWIPISIRLPGSYIDGEVSTELDGADVTDPLGFIRGRYNHLDGEADYLGWLDLRGVDDGPHTLDFTIRKEGGGGKQQLSTSFDLQRAACELRIRTVDGEGRPVAARVAIDGPDGQPFDVSSPDAAPVDPLRQRDIGVTSLFTQAGEGTWPLPCQTYTLTAVRNPLHEVGRATVELVQGRTELTLDLPRVVDDGGRFTADLHVHTGRSPDAFIPDQMRWRSILAAGLDLVVITDHDLVTDPANAMALLAGDDALLALPGTEAQMRPIRDDEDRLTPGHLNALPLPLDAELAPDPPDHLADYLTWYHGMTDPWPGVDAPMVQLNHPRGIHFDAAGPTSPSVHALFFRNGFEPDLPLTAAENAWFSDPNPAGDTLLDWDAVEVVNRFSWPLYLEVRRDWFSLMNQGVFITGTGNSDSHAAEVELAGFPVNLLPRCGDAADAACLVDGMRAGRNSVSNGPVVELDVLGAGPGGSVVAPTDGVVVVRARVQAASWVMVPQVRLVVNGEVVRTEERDDDGIDRFEDGRLDRTFQWTVQPQADAWILVEAGWELDPDLQVDDRSGEVYARVAPGYVPLGFTNPVRVDIDGDGWTAPGLPE